MHRFYSEPLVDLGHYDNDRPSPQRPYSGSQGGLARAHDEEDGDTLQSRPRSWLPTSPTHRAHHEEAEYQPQRQGPPFRTYSQALYGQTRHNSSPEEEALSEEDQAMPLRTPTTTRPQYSPDTKTSRPFASRLPDHWDPSLDLSQDMDDVYFTTSQAYDPHDISQDDSFASVLNQLNQYQARLGATGASSPSSTQRSPRSDPLTLVEAVQQVQYLTELLESDREEARNASVEANARIEHLEGTLTFMQRRLVQAHDAMDALRTENEDLKRQLRAQRDVEPERWQQVADRAKWSQEELDRVVEIAKDGMDRLLQGVSGIQTVKLILESLHRIHTLPDDP